MEKTSDHDSDDSGSLKIKTKGEENGERHCLCDSRDYSTFMICCDQCGIWYHGSCVEVSRTMSKKIEKFFCSICISKDNSLEIVYKCKKERTPKIEQQQQKEKTEKREKRAPSLSATAEKDKCGNCIGCMWKADCGKCTNCNAEKQPCLRRICVQAGQQSAQPPSHPHNSVFTSGQPPRKRKLSKSSKRDAEDSDWKPASPPVNTKAGRRPAVRDETNNSTTLANDERRGKREKEASNASISANLAKVYNNYYRQKKQKKEEEKQCLGPGCVNSARSNSSYCSDDCGISLAERRLKYILPERIRNYYGQRPESERLDEEKMRVLLESKNGLEEELKRLDECVENVMNWISTLSSVQDNGSSESNAVDDGTFIVTCAVCAMECSIRNIGKHMQRCFVRTERQSTYGTAHKLPQNPRNLLCDAYNKIDKSYCKRLRVMCSEHYKEEEELKFCGAPLIWFDGRAVEFKNLFVDSEILSEHMFCMEKRKHCNVHTNWAQNALGLIDNERMNILYQLDENNEKRRRIQHSIASRGDVISLLCNYTISESPTVQAATATVTNNT